MPTTCRYVLSVTEYQRAFGAYSLLKPVTLGKQLLVFLWVAFILNVVIIVTHLRDLQDRRQFFFDFIVAMNAELVVALFLLLALDLLRGGKRRRRRVHPRALRRAGLLDTPFDISIFHAGITVDMPDRKVDWRWNSFTRLGEDKDGFVLLVQPQGRKFLWLPKSGFSSVVEIEATRDILRQHVADYRVLD